MFYQMILKQWKKISNKVSDNYCITKNNESLHIYETSCESINESNKYYNMNIKNKQITEVILDDNINSIDE